MADIEAELVPLIQAETGFQTGTRYPNPRPDRLVFLRRQGGAAALAGVASDSVFRDKPFIDMYVSGETESDAWAAAQKIRAFMLTIPQHQPLSVTCYRVSEEVCGWSDDDLDGVFIAPRVWLSYELSLRYNP